VIGFLIREKLNKDEGILNAVGGCFPIATFLLYPKLPLDILLYSHANSKKMYIFQPVRLPRLGKISKKHFGAYHK